MSALTKQILNRLQSLGDPEIAAHSQRFFKTGPGEYGEGNIFLGIRVPVLRSCLRDHRWIPLSEAQELLQSSYHEARLLALLILVAQYGSSRKEADRRDIYEAYLQHTRFINNWDLVDCSAQYIVGPISCPGIESRSPPLPDPETSGIGGSLFWPPSLLSGRGSLRIPCPWPKFFCTTLKILSTHGGTGNNSSAGTGAFAA